MRKYKYLSVLILIPIFLFLFAKPSKAESSNNPVFATINFVQSSIQTSANSFQSAVNSINGKILELQSSLNLVREDINNLKTENTDLKNENTVQDEKIQELEKRVSKLEITPTPTSIPSVKEGQFIIGSSGESQIVEATGYTRITITIVGYQLNSALFYSDNGISWAPFQSKFGEDSGTGPSYTFEVKGKYYKVNSWAVYPQSFYYRFFNS